MPGAPEVTIECLPESTPPDELRAAGYDLMSAGEGERILANAVTQVLTLSSSGALEPLTSASSRPVATKVVHAGVARVPRYAFTMEYNLGGVRAPSDKPF